MALTVNFKTQRGLINNRKFNVGEGVSIYGKASTLITPVNPGTLVRLDITDNYGTSIFTQDKLTDVFGDYDFWFRTPYNDAQLNVRLYATYPISGIDTVNIPIAVGNLNPKTLPRPEVEFSLLNFLPIALIGLAALVIIKNK